MDIFPAQPGFFTMILLLCSGMLLYAGVQAGILALTGHRRSLYLYFSLICLIAASVLFLEMKSYGAASIEEAAPLLQWRAGIYSLLPPALLGFVATYTGQHRFMPWLIATGSISLALLIVNFVAVPHGIHFSYIKNIPPLIFPCGEKLTIHRGGINAWSTILRLLFTAVLVWAFARCGMMFRKGARRSSFFLGAALSLPLLSLIFGILIDLGYMKSFFIGGFSFFGLVLFMSVALGFDLREHNKRLSHLAYHDYLTGLPNIARLQEQLCETLTDSDFMHMKGALLLVGLDNFKTINDVLGHSIGDKLLKEVGKKMNGIELEDAGAARLGGDEFMLLLPKLDVDMQAASARAHSAAEQILDVLSRPFVIDGNSLQISACVGIALFPEDHERDADIMQRADLALQRAKESGPGNIQVYLSNMQAETSRNLDLERGLRRALDNNELALHFQPQSTMAGRVTGAEVLLRWKQPNGDFISPSLFVPIAEKTGLIRPIGDWALRQACEHIKTCERLMPDYQGHVSINVSTWQFMQKNYEESVRRTLDASGIDPARLVLEITESAFIHDLEEAISKIKSLRDLGLRFSIDDFGTGYASLSYLRKLPVQELKIDKAFVRNLGPGSRDADLAETIISIGRCMGMEVLAEGVETESQRSTLAAMNCSTFQGYLLAAPMDEESFLHWLQNRYRHQEEEYFI